jgi:hypothetical protein
MSCKTGLYWVLLKFWPLYTAFFLSPLGGQDALFLYLEKCGHWWILPAVLREGFAAGRMWLEVSEGKVSYSG